jgi:succinate dehydrogenase / fumarate reductase flavoprotein subunit
MTDLDNITRHDVDVLVVGAGGAGLRAGIQSAEEGAGTAVVTKSLLGKAHTVMAEGGCAAALRNVDERDNWKVHFRDTVRGSKLLNDWRMAEYHAKEAPDRVRELEKWGAAFDRNEEGWINQRPFGGHEYNRLAHVGDRTGLELIRTLQDKAVATDGLEVHAETTVTKLFKDGGRVSGALAYDRSSGDLHVFQADAVILACGGVGQIYKYTSNSWEYTGDGFALAFEAGAELMDMEFVQFHPTGMIWPPSVRGLLVTEGVRGEGGILRNAEGERFMFDYVPEIYEGEYAESEEEVLAWLDDDDEARRPPELLTRDIVAKAIHDEVKAGRGSPHGGAFLDISWREDEYIHRKLPSMVEQFEELAGVDITEEPMEVGPTMHYHMGGVRVDPETEMTTVPGLFAAGETAAGLHGANRLGGNSLSDLLVFGKRSGEHAAKYAQELDDPVDVDDADVERAIDDLMAPLEREEGPDPYDLHEELQGVMDEGAQMIRTEESLSQAVEELEDLAERAENVSVGGSTSYNPGWHRAGHLPNMILAGKAIAQAALMREESRGAHLRTDYPDYDDENWGDVNIVIRNDDGEMELVTEPAPERPPEIQEIIDADAEEISSDAYGVKEVMP